MRQTIPSPCPSIRARRLPAPVQLFLPAYQASSTCPPPLGTLLPPLGTHSSPFFGVAIWMPSNSHGTGPTPCGQTHLGPCSIEFYFTWSHAVAMSCFYAPLTAPICLHFGAYIRPLFFYLSARPSSSGEGLSPCRRLVGLVGVSTSRPTQFPPWVTPRVTG